MLSGCVFLFIWLLALIRVHTQDLSLYGLYEYAGTEITSRKRKEIYSKCFQGFGFTSCSPNLPTDDIVLAYNLDYYNDLASIQGQFYCLQCCGSPPDYTDTWDLSCEMDASSLASMIGQFGYEARFARRATPTDSEVVRCPFTRKQCDFSGDVPVCDRSNDTFIHGYTLTIEVQQLDSNFEYWRGVSKCEFSDIDERYYPLQIGQSLNEKIILKHKPIDTFTASDIGKLMIILFSCLLFAYIALYFLRRKRCEYCQGKLVLSPRLCYKCVLVGAQPPDPVLMKALEERGLHMQGKMPERLGCIQRNCVGCVRCCYNCWTCKCCCVPCAWFCRNCCCCCKCCHCCEPKPPERIVPDDVNAMSIEQIAQVEAALMMERGGDNVVSFDLPIDSEAPETIEPIGVSGKIRPKKEKSSKRDPAEIRAEKLEEEKRVRAKEKEKNPNILVYPRETILKAVKHPSVY